MPARRQVIVCKNCGVRITINRKGRATARTKRKKAKSAARQEIGRRLAASLPRDAKGKFLPRGSRNLFTGAKGKSRTREFSTLPSSLAKRRRTRLPVIPEEGSSRFRFGGVSDFFPSFADVRDLALEAASSAAQQAILAAARGQLALPST